MTLPDGIADAFALLNPIPEAVTDPASATDPAPEAAPVDVAQVQSDLTTEQARNTALNDKLHRLQLEGRVSDVNAAMKMLDPARHLDKDGNVKYYDLMAEFPSLSPKYGPTTTDGAGGPQGSAPLTLDSALRTGDLTTINYVFDQELKG